MTHQNYSMVFPGQGSQSLKMLASLANIYPQVKATYHIASKVLGYDLWQLTQEGPEEKLNQTEYTQPALLTASVAIWECWKTKHQPLPALLAGHSLGEYSALVCSEVIHFEEAVQLVAWRGRFMQEAVPVGTGAMAAIVGLDETEVVSICKKAAHEEILSPANYNSIGQVVIAGHVGAVNRAVELAKQKGAKIAKLIPISVPSHCALMKSAAQRLAEKLADVKFSSPKIPVIANFDVRAHASAESIRHALIEQLTHPVRWVETIQFIWNQGVKCLLECGPGKVLTGLNKRIIPEIVTHPMGEPEFFKEPNVAIAKYT